MVFPIIRFVRWEGQYLFSSEFVTDRNIDKNFRENSTVIQSYGEAVSNCTFRRIVIVQCNLGIFDTMHLGTQRIDARIRSDVVLIVFGRQTSVDQWDCNLT